MLNRERREKERNTWAWQADKQRQRREAARQMPFACKDNKHRQAAWTMAPGQLQDSARTLAWHFGNAITAFCFRSALLKPLPLFRQRSSPAGDRNREANAERTRKKGLVLACRRFYALARCLSWSIVAVFNIYNVAEINSVIWSIMLYIIYSYNNSIVWLNPISYDLLSF